MSSYDELFDEISRRDAELEKARANKKKDPETFRKVANEYGTWRRALRLLGGQPLGSPPWPPEVLAFIKAHPQDPRVVAAKAELRAQTNTLIGD